MLALEQRDAAPVTVGATAEATAVVLPAEVRARAVAMFRELADKLESGELAGARIEWREGLPFVTRVEMDGTPRLAIADDGSCEMRREVRLETIYLTKE